jgi:hypothetical protein
LGYAPEANIWVKAKAILFHAHDRGLKSQNCVFRFVQLFSLLMKASTKGKGKTKEVPFDPIFFAASVPARKPTAKDIKDVKEHENDPIEPKDHDTMDDAVEDL